MLKSAVSAMTLTVIEITTRNIKNFGDFNALSRMFVGRRFVRRANYDRKRSRAFISWLGLLFLFVFKLFMLLPMLLFELL